MARVRDVFTRSMPRTVAVKGLAKAMPVRQPAQQRAQNASAGRYAGLALRAAPTDPIRQGLAAQSSGGMSAADVGAGMRSGLATNLGAAQAGVNTVSQFARGLFGKWAQQGATSGGNVRPPSTLRPGGLAGPFNTVPQTQVNAVARNMLSNASQRSGLANVHQAGQPRGTINPVTNRPYVPQNANWRNENAGILMTADEYQRRNNARLSVSNPNSPLYNPTSPFYQASMDQYFKNAITAANKGENLFEWEKQNPRPYAFWEPTAEEERARNAALVNAGLSNYKWVPFGSGFIENTEAAPLAENVGGGGGEGGGYYPGYEGGGGGGGGGGGYDYTPDLARWWNQMAMWSFSPADYNKG